MLHYNGMTNEMHITEYTPKEDCESHWTYGDIIELPLRADTTTLEEMMQIIHRDLGPEAILELDQELILSLKCPNCKTEDKILKPISQVSFSQAHCPTCGLLRETEMTHIISGEEPFLSRTLTSIGIPPLHILRAINANQYLFYELSGDLKSALHFNHFEKKTKQPEIKLHDRIKIKEKIQMEGKPKIKIHESPIKLKIRQEEKIPQIHLD